MPRWLPRLCRLVSLLRPCSTINSNSNNSKQQHKSELYRSSLATGWSPWPPVPWPCRWPASTSSVPSPSSPRVCGPLTAPPWLMPFTIGPYRQHGALFSCNTQACFSWAHGQPLWRGGGWVAQCCVPSVLTRQPWLAAQVGPHYGVRCTGAPLVSLCLYHNCSVALLEHCHPCHVSCHYSFHVRSPPRGQLDVVAEGVPHSFARTLPWPIGANPGCK